jgi:hypothetical protein
MEYTGLNRIIGKILDQINGIQQSQWDYYYNHSNRLLNKPSFQGNNHSEFIKAYFKRGGKENIFKSYFSISKSLLLRSPHTVSIYFIGILIYSNTKINKIMNWGENPAEYDIFPFVWFLTCLFHDFGYDYEVNTNEFLSKIWDIDSLKKVLKIKYDLLRCAPIHTPEDLHNSISKYFLYKRFKRKEIDHGIVAGLYLYDKLVKNRHYKNRQNTNGLFWGDNLDGQYALAGAKIAIHNIWFPDESSKTDYKQFELDCLINRPPISLNEGPLLFLLGLVDTIDPIKLYNSRYSSSQILEEILIAFSENEIRLSVVPDSKLDFDILKNRCVHLNSWLKVDVISDSSDICIKF